MELINKFDLKFLTYSEKYPFYFHTVEGQEGPDILIAGKRLINFASFSYLGLFDHHEVIEAGIQGLKKLGAGVQGTRRHGGDLQGYSDIESICARLYRKEDAVLMQSAFNANLSVLQSFSDKQTVVFCAKKNHASIHDGCTLSKAKIVYFKHNDLQQLAHKIKREPADSRKIIIADSVFSMDGDLIDLPYLIRIRDENPNTLLIIDDCHGFGVLGKSGRGIHEHYHIQGRGADLIITSLSKAIPGNGGIVAGSGHLINYLRYQSRQVIFSSSQSPGQIESMKAALLILEREGESRVNALRDRVDCLRSALTENNMACSIDHSPITTIPIGNETLAFAIAQHCFDHGLYVLPVVYPAVSVGAERLRITININHSHQTISTGVGIIKEAMNIINRHGR